MKVERQVAPLRRQVVQLMRQDILDAHLAPGQRLLESELCASYDVSRTVVREALRQLESEHLITMLPNRGPIVTVLTGEEIRAIYEVRTNLEGLAGARFAERATDPEATALVRHAQSMEATYLHGTLQTRRESKDAFYELLLAGAHNSVLASTLAGIHSRVSVFRHYAFTDQKRVAHSMKELRAIVAAAAVERDPDAAQRACEQHIRTAGELALLEYEARLPAEDGGRLTSR